MAVKAKVTKEGLLIPREVAERALGEARRRSRLSKSPDGS